MSLRITKKGMEIYMSDKIDKNNDNKKEDNFERICYLCRRPESKVGKVIRIPNNIDICSDCMQKTFDTMNNMDNPYASMMGLTPNMILRPNQNDVLPKP